MKTALFQSSGHCWVFQICWHIECSTFTASSFRIWNSSTGIPSPPLALFEVMLSKAHLTSHSRMSGSRWVITPSWFNTSTKYYFQACIRDPYVLLKGTISIKESVQELSCQDCKLYTCLNSSLYNSNHSFVILRRRLGIWLPVNQTRPWENSPETHGLLKVIKKVLQCSERFIGLLIAVLWKLLLYPWLQQ